MSEFCFICKKHLTDGKTVVVSRGMQTLIDASAARDDEFIDYLKSQKSVTIYVDCRKSYTRKSSIAVVKRQHEDDAASTSKISPPRTRTRVSESGFSFKQNCLFCGNEANEEAEKKKVQNFRKKILKLLHLRLKNLS